MKSPGELLAGNVRTDLLGRCWVEAKKYTVELALVPVMFLGMLLVQRIRGTAVGRGGFRAGVGGDPDADGHRSF